MDPLVTEVPAELIREFDTVGVSGKSVLAIIIQEDENGTLLPQKVTASQLSHVAIAVAHEGRLQWFEFAKEGGAFAPLGKYLHADEHSKGFALFRPAEMLTDIQKASMRLEVGRLAGMSYDATGLVGKLLHLLLLRKLLKKNPLSGAGYFCSVGVEKVYRAGNVRITEYDDVRLNEPKDFMLTEKLERIL